MSVSVQDMGKPATFAEIVVARSGLNAAAVEWATRAHKPFILNPPISNFLKIGKEKRLLWVYLADVKMVRKNDLVRCSAGRTPLLYPPIPGPD